MNVRGYSCYIVANGEYMPRPQDAEKIFLEKKFEKNWSGGPEKISPVDWTPEHAKKIVDYCCSLVTFGYLNPYYCQIEEWLRFMKKIGFEPILIASKHDTDGILTRRAIIIDPDQDPYLLTFNHPYQYYENSPYYKEKDKKLTHNDPV